MLALNLTAIRLRLTSVWGRLNLGIVFVHTAIASVLESLKPVVRIGRVYPALIRTVAGTATELTENSASRSRLSMLRAILNSAPLLHETIRDTIPLDVRVGQCLKSRDDWTHFDDINRCDEHSDLKPFVHTSLHRSELLEYCGHTVNVLRNVGAGIGEAEGHKLDHH